MKYLSIANLIIIRGRALQNQVISPGSLFGKSNQQCKMYRRRQTSQLFFLSCITHKYRSNKTNRAVFAFVDAKVSAPFSPPPSLPFPPYAPFLPCIVYSRRTSYSSVYFQPPKQCTESPTPRAEAAASAMGAG